MDRTAVYPGTFDPVTYGHIDVIKRASHLFDKVYVACAHTGSKRCLFTIRERLQMLRRATRSFQNVVVEDFEGLVVEYVRRRKSRIIIRGLRMISDFEYEFQMALTNRKMNKNVDTVFLMPGEEFFYVSSTLVKEIAKLKGHISCFVPEVVEKALKEKFNY